MIPRSTQQPNESESIVTEIAPSNPLDTAEARFLTDSIKVSAEQVWQLITRAYSGRADLALGYGSWDDYCAAEFGSSRLRLPREERAEVVASLRESGLSIRAIAAATGDSTATVRRDLGSNSGGTIVPPAQVVDEDALAGEIIGEYEAGAAVFVGAGADADAA